MTHDEPSRQNGHEEPLDRLLQQVPEDEAAELAAFGKQMDTYATYLYYRVEHSLYVLLKKDMMPDLTWQEVVGMFSHLKEIRTSGQYVLAVTIANFFEDGVYDFSGEEAAMINDEIEISPRDGKIHAADLFPGDESGRSLISCFLANALAALCKEMSERTGIDVKTAAQLAELPGIEEREIMASLMRGFRRSLTQLDFAATWTAAGIDYLENAIEESEKGGE